MAQRVSNTTTDHDTIRRWAEERGGWPAQVASTAQGGQTGIIRIDFPGYTGEGKLERISWDEWFEKFDDANLALVYEETTAGGERSNFNKLVGRETAEARAEGVRSSRRAAKREGRYGRGTTTRAEAETLRTMRGRRAKRAGRGARAGGRGETKRTARGGTKRGTGRATARGEGRRQATRSAARSAGRTRRTGGRKGRGTPRTSRASSRGRRRGGRSSRRPD